MKRKPDYLIRQLIDNKISRDEMNEFLKGLEDDETSKAYEEYLENYYNEIMKSHQKVITEKKPE